MHKFIDYICDELEELEKKADKGKLTMAEIQYADILAHLKKNLLTADAMMSEDDGYSNDGGYYVRGGSYARGGRGRGGNVRRDARGRYSSEYRDGSYEGDGMYSREEAKDNLMMQLKNMERNADEESKHMIKKWIKQVEEQ